MILDKKNIVRNNNAFCCRQHYLVRKVYGEPEWCCEDRELQIYKYFTILQKCYKHRISVTECWASVREDPNKE